MPRLYHMSFEGKPHYRWTKMYKGVRYKVRCYDLPGLSEKDWTKEGSYQQANQWWRQQLANLLPKDVQEKNLARICAELQDHINRYGLNFKPPTTIQECDKVRGFLAQRFAMPTATDLVYGGRLITAPAVPENKTLAFHLARFFVDKETGKKPVQRSTLRVLKSNLKALGEKWGTQDVSLLGEAKVEEWHTHLQELDLDGNTRAKKWDYFTQFVRYLYSSHAIETMPRNLTTLGFTVSDKPVVIQPLAEVRKALVDLPERLRAWAMLSLNCSMNNVDIATLTKDMVADGFLTRRRRKTARCKSVPVVRYKLWPETITLMDKHKSDHAALWFLSMAGSPLLNAETSKDLLGQAFALGNRSSIRLKDYRAIGAQQLASHPEYHDLVELYLGHSAKSVAEKHYTGASPRLDAALDWLRGQIFS